jgi:dTDP-glucose pyrophosphorylase
MKLNRYIINSSSSVIDALIKIDQLTSTLTIFIINDNEQVIGTVTDGDIRRGLIKGLSLDSPIFDFAYTDFSYLTEGSDDFSKLKEFRQRKLKAVPLLSIDKKLIKLYDFTITKSILPVDAVIMAGGKGIRLRPLTNETPKPLLKVGNKEIIAYNFDRLHQYGINNQFVAVNYMGEQIEKYCNNYKNKEIHFTLIKENDYLGTAGALTLIKNFEHEEILLMNSDILTNIDYEDFYISFIEKNADIMVASIPYQISLPYAILESENHLVKSFKEKPSYTYYANAGIYLLKRKLLNKIPKDQFFNATDLMDMVLQNNFKLLHYPITSYWLDIGKHEDFERAQKDISHIDFE